jgi:flagellin
MNINSYTPSTSSYYKNYAEQQKHTQNIASGKKVNSAADNAAALAIIQGMYGQINGDNQAARNIQDSVSLLNTAEGAMNDSTDVAQRMRELSLQAANGTLTDQDRSYIQQEMNQLGAQLNANANNTEFNTIKTNDGSLTNFTTQVGANSGQTAVTSIGSTTTAALGISADVSTQSAAASSLSTIDSGIASITSARTAIGATVNALGYTSGSVTQAAESLTSAASVMGDADIASELSLFKQSGIKLYTNLMALSKSMNQRESVLSLLV